MSRVTSGESRMCAWWSVPTTFVHLIAVSMGIGVFDDARNRQLIYEAFLETGCFANGVRLLGLSVQYWYKWKNEPEHKALVERELAEAKTRYETKKGRTGDVLRDSLSDEQVDRYVEHIAELIDAGGTTERKTITIRKPRLDPEGHPILDDAGQPVLEIDKEIQETKFLPLNKYHHDLIRKLMDKATLSGKHLTLYSVNLLQFLKVQSNLSAEEVEHITGEIQQFQSLFQRKALALSGKDS